MTQRQLFVLRAALIYAQANLSDLNDAFAKMDDEQDPDNLGGNLSVNGIEGQNLDESEVAQLIFEFQG